MDTVTASRIAFMSRLDAWAKGNGYKRRGGLWHAEDHYITMRRDSNDGPFIAEKTAYRTGAHISDVAI